MLSRLMMVSPVRYPHFCYRMLHCDVANEPCMLLLAASSSSLQSDTFQFQEKNLITSTVLQQVVIYSFREADIIMPATTLSLLSLRHAAGTKA